MTSRKPRMKRPGIRTRLNAYLRDYNYRKSPQLVMVTGLSGVQFGLIYYFMRNFCNLIG